MNSTRTTNALLFVIALSLVTIAAKPLLISIFPEAEAYGEIPSLQGCYRDTAFPPNCDKSLPILVDEIGRLIISDQKR